MVLMMNSDGTIRNPAGFGANAYRAIAGLDENKKETAMNSICFFFRNLTILGEEYKHETQYYDEFLGWE